MNIDTDTQWSYWSGVKEFESKYRPYLQTQIGNPDGAEKPNKKYYDPREMMRSAEVSTVDRLKQCFEDLNCVGRLGLEEAGDPSNVLGPRRGGLPTEEGWRGAAPPTSSHREAESSRERVGQCARSRLASFMVLE